MQTRAVLAESQMFQTAIVHRPLTILFASQTGNAQAVAQNVAGAARAQCLASVVIDMDSIDVAQLSGIEHLLIVTSTYGEGEMPDNAEALWLAISADDAPCMKNTFFSVLALGDSNYDDFCRAGELWDSRLEQLGAKRICNRVNCDFDFDIPAKEWMDQAVVAFADFGCHVTPAISLTDELQTRPKYSLHNPFSARMIGKKNLSKENSSKEIVHYELSLAGCAETYQAGDTLHVIPKNRPDFVAALVEVLGANADDDVIWNGESMTLAELLTSKLEIRIPSKELLFELAKVSGDGELSRLLHDGDAELLNDFLRGKDSLDLLNDFPIGLSAARFCAFCKGLAPRAYSISSSINAHPEEVHLTISSVRYDLNGRSHLGVCSTFFADEVEIGDSVDVYFSPNKNFSVPDDDTLPIIMVGPGTGIAPFRGFLEERQARNASGDNWLFFGDRNSGSDFIYQDELQTLQDSGLLTRLDLAFSRDQQEKIYVQDRMLEHGAELFNWLERGGYFYVCGDAFCMAKDVDRVLHQLIVEHGQLSVAAADSYVARLKKEKRYVRDVY